MATKSSTQYCIRISYDSGIPEAIKEYTAKTGKAASYVFQEGARLFLAAQGLCNAGVMQECNAGAMQACNASQPPVEQGKAPCNAGVMQASMLAPDPTPAVPTYTPTDPLDIVAEAFFHKPYAVLTLDSKNMCDFIADHPITGPDMVLSFPDEWIKAGIEYMNNPTPVPVYQPKPIENAEPISENLKRIRAYRAAKDEAFRQSLAELESLYPEDSDDMFYADSDENVPEEISDYSEENSEEL